MTVDTLAAPDELFQKGRGLIKRIARRYARVRPPGVGVEDLEQECAVALHRAADKFDPDRGRPFEAYAVVVLARAARAYLRRESGRGLRGMAAAAARPGFQAFAVNEDGTGVPSVELVADRTVWRPEWTPAEWEQLLACLSPLQRRVVELRLRQHLTAREVGQALGFRPSRVTFLWQQALARIEKCAARACDCC